ncbi:hypothetical protein [Verrucosispora sioxanthis]|uniref:hypothetical protein n=1 Tax=Verrucosispora sioxanthis TaxID=2499994 RepID=UPI001C102381|nr:hypothetical protein [Verrucosispora sioxanthis]
MAFQLAHPAVQLGDLLGGGQAHHTERPLDLEPHQLGQGLAVGRAGRPQLLGQGLQLCGRGTGRSHRSAYRVLCLLSGRLRQAHGQFEVGAPRVLHA